MSPPKTTGLGRYRSPRNLDPELGRRLRKAREARGMARPMAARHVGVTLDTIQNWEEGRTEPRVSELIKLALAYLVAPSDLLGVT